MINMLCFIVSICCHYTSTLSLKTSLKRWYSIQMPFTYYPLLRYSKPYPLHCCLQLKNKNIVCLSRVGFNCIIIWVIVNLFCATKMDSDVVSRKQQMLCIRTLQIESFLLCLLVIICAFLFCGVSCYICRKGTVIIKKGFNATHLLCNSMTYHLQRSPSCSRPFLSLLHVNRAIHPYLVQSRT